MIIIISNFLLLFVLLSSTITIIVHCHPYEQHVCILKSVFLISHSSAMSCWFLRCMFTKLPSLLSFFFFFISLSCWILYINLQIYRLNYFFYLKLFIELTNKKLANRMWKLKSRFQRKKNIRFSDLWRKRGLLEFLVQRLIWWKINCFFFILAHE